MTRKSIWAIVAGILFVVVVTTLVDAVLHRVGVFPPMNAPLTDRLAVIATLYRVVISVAGAWLTARIAPDRPMRHALFLGVVGIVLALIGLLATWNRGLGPNWYPLALVLLAIPQCWLGGWLYVRTKTA